MNYLIILIATLSFNCKNDKSKVVTDNMPSSPDTISQVGKHYNDTSIEKLKAGFYLAILDTSNSLGYKLRNKKEYYFLDAAPAVTLNEIDNIYIEFNSQIDRYTLIFKLNDIATKKWFDFTTEYNGMKVALVLNEEIFHVSTIASPISSGETVLTNAPTKNEIDEFKELIEKEIKKAKKTEQ
jgi:preprotein translocase subunit SecD